MKQPPELVGRAYRFSLAALRFYRKLPKSPDAQVPGVQFLKAATSAWSNYRASQRGRSRAEFIAKLGTATEESDESVGWLEFMRDGHFSLFTFHFLLSYFISPASMRVRSLFCSVGSGHVVYGLYAHGGFTVLLKSSINLPLTGASA
jgi:four helix bundle protein